MGHGDVKTAIHYQHPELEILQVARQPCVHPFMSSIPPAECVGDSTKEPALARHSSNEGEYGSDTRGPQVSSQ